MILNLWLNLFTMTLRLGISVLGLAVILSLHLAFTNGAILTTQNSVTSQQSISGESVTLTCVTDNTDKIMWRFLDHDLIVGQAVNGSVNLLADSTVYSFTANISSSVEYNLTLVNTQDSFGTYQCVSSTDSTVITFTVLLTNYTYTPATTPIESLSCCKEKGVSENCLPVCDPAHNDLTNFSITPCAAHVANIQACNKGDRNAARCCAARGMQPDCLPVCMEGLSMMLLKKCTAYKDVMSFCFGEAKYQVPSPPVQVSALSDENGTSILVTWSPPLSDLTIITGYRIFFRKRTTINNSAEMAQFMSRNVDSHEYSYIIQSTIPDSLYEIYVQTTSDYGSSFSSTKVILEVQKKIPQNTTSRSVEECCTSAKVPVNCQIFLCKGMPGTFPLPLLQTCQPFLPLVLGCYGNYGNHTKCCQTNIVQASCLPYCSGDKNLDTSGLVHCVNDMSLIAQCMDSGVASVPTAATNLKAVFIGHETVDLSWTAPQFSDPIVYQVLVNNIVQKTVPDATTTTVTGLLPNTEYLVKVVATNDKGSSLPSNTLDIITLSIPVVTHATGTWDPVACCQSSSNVTSTCATSCNANSPDMNCKSQWPAMAKCLSDHRSHKTCCNSAGVSANCLFLCELSASDNPDSTQVQNCFGFSENYRSVMDCYKETNIPLPSPPVDLRVTSLGSTKVILTWSAPLIRPKSITKFVLTLVQLNGTTARTQDIPGDHLMVSVSNLAIETTYIATLRSYINDDFSLPSNILIISTLPDFPFDWNSDLRKDAPVFNSVPECCEAASIPAECMPLCNTSTQIEMDFYTTHQKCLNSLLPISKCLTANRNNMPCCVKWGVSTICQPLCKGSITQNLTTNPTCLKEQTLIRNCYLAGYDLLPVTPQIIHVHALSSSMVEVQLNQIGIISSTDNPIKLLIILISKSMKSRILDFNAKGTYNIIGLLPDTQYGVTVSAFNLHGSSLPTAISSVVTLPQKGFQVFIIANPNRDIKADATTVTLTCMHDIIFVAGSSYKWYLDGIVLSSQTSKVISLSPATRMDSGQYTCTVITGSWGSATGSLFLTVQYPLLGAVSPAEGYQEVALFKPTTFLCIFSGYPKTISWNAPDGSILDDSSLVDIKTNLKGHTTTSELHIFKLYESWYGDFTCTGKNSLGSKPFIFQIIKPGSAPPTPPSKDTVTPLSEPFGLLMTGHGKTWVAFSWHPPSQFFTGFKIKILDLSTEDVTEITLKIGSSGTGRMVRSINQINVPKNTTSYNATNLHPGHTYSVSIFTQNGNNMSPSSHPLTVYTPGPPVAPGHLMARLTTSIDVSVTWETQTTSLVPVTEYTIKYLIDGTVKDISSLAKTQKSYFCLPPNTDIEFRVWAQNGDGTSDFSSIKIATTKDLPKCKRTAPTTERTTSDINAGHVMLIIILILVLIFVIFLILIFYWSRHGIPSALRQCPPLYRVLVKLSSMMSPSGGSVSAAYSTHNQKVEFENPIRFDSLNTNVYSDNPSPQTSRAGATGNIDETYATAETRYNTNYDA